MDMIINSSKRTRGLLFFLFLFCASNLWAQKTVGKIAVVCVDAGHGGRDPGALGLHGAREKDITLAISLRVGQLLKAKYPSLKIVYTRTSDKSVDLRERTAIANRVHADLFLSIHTNAFSNRSVKGIETYVLGSNSTAQNLAVAMKENAAITYEDDYSTKYQGFDPNRAESYIIFNLLQNVHLDHSLDFASHIQDALINSTKRHDRGVRQAPFWVLKDASMPSVLVEIGFISNVEEERILKSKSGQERIAQAIVKAFVSYKTNYEQHNKLIAPPLAVIPKESTQELNNSTEKTSNLFYGVQVASSIEKMKTLSHINVKGEIRMIHAGGRYRYFVEKCYRYSDVSSALTRTKRLVKDCFPIAIYNGKLISIGQAKQLENR